MKVIIASDHRGFELKEKLKSYFAKNKIAYEDFGPLNYNEDDDYPDFIFKAAERVIETNNKGIIIGGSGEGEAIAANKVKGIRAVVYYGSQKEILKLSKIDNNANILSLGARFLSDKEALEAVDLWLKIPFSKEKRHVRRLKKISDFEEKR